MRLILIKTTQLLILLTRINPSDKKLPLFLALLFLSLPTIAAPAPFDEILVAYVGETNNEAWRGVHLGLREANIQGKFLGLSFRLVENPSVLQSRVLGGFKSVISDGDPSLLRNLASKYSNLPIFNVASKNESLRQECFDNLFHVITSEDMLDDAARQWLRKDPASKATPTGWHYSFKKYAAAQLNKRYNERFKEPMNEISWAGWASIKIISDTISRVGDTNDLLFVLKNDLAFDGQKGISLSFRETGQLRQPLLMIEAEQVVGEAPVTEIVSDSSLDSLGITACYK